MDFNQPPLIRIYQSCQMLISIKRKLFSLLKITDLPHSPHNEQKRTISTKAYLYIKKIAKEVSFLLADFSLGQSGQNHITVVDKALTNLKNHNEFLSQEEKLIFEAHQMIERWSKIEDPVIYYEQRERNQLKKNLKGKLQQINTISVACKQTKKPLYIRKLQRQLKQNLYVVTQNERKYNTHQFGLSVSVRKKIIKLLGKLLESLNNKQKSGFVDVEKNMLLSTYIDVFYGNEGKVTEKDIKCYRKDLLKTAKSISSYFEQQKLCFEGLLSFLRALEGTIKNFHTAILKEEDRIIESISEVSGDINHIVNFEQALEIINSMKSYFITAEELSEFKRRIPHLQRVLESTIAEIGQFTKNIMKREFKSKNAQIAQFIEDKKFLETLSKRQDNFETTLFESLGIFLEKVYKDKGLIDHKPLEREDLRKFKYEQAVLNIFQNYFAEIENEGKSTSGKSTFNSEIYKMSLNQHKQMDEIQEFINSLTVFEGDIDWKDSYQCSLGPRLLIHGKMKIIPEGLIYHSSFNKRNYFFGRTKIFIPKQEIFQINKQSAFVVFDDVIEIVTKKGKIYFHALGKRSKMITQLNENFFPEVNAIEGNVEELQFNECRESQEVLLNRIRPCMINLEYLIGQGDVPNIDFRTYFHRYESEQEFQYQGKVYENFKIFTLEMAGGTNIQGAKFSPGLPYYMQLKGTNLSPVDIQQSQRFFTYKKEVPMIPFVSKGGHGICQEKCIFRWGGPKHCLYESFTTLSGFSLTQGMLVKTRIIFEEKKNGVHYTMSGEVTFETNSATNNLLRGPALSNLKSFVLQTNEIMKKVEKSRKVKKGGKKSAQGSDDSEYQSKISLLSNENAKLKKIIFHSAIMAIILYIVTIFMLIY